MPLPVEMMNSPYAQLQRRGAQYPAIPTYGRYGEQAVAMANRPQSAPRGTTGYSPLPPLPPAMTTPGGGGGGGGTDYLSALLGGARLANLSGINLSDLLGNMFGGENAAENTANEGASDTSATNEQIANDLANMPAPTMPVIPPIPQQATPGGVSEVTQLPTEPGYVPAVGNVLPVAGGLLGAGAGLGAAPAGGSFITEAGGALASQTGAAAGSAGAGSGGAALGGGASADAAAAGAGSSGLATAGVGAAAITPLVLGWGGFYGDQFMDPEIDAAMRAQRERRMAGLSDFYLAPPMLGQDQRQMLADQNGMDLANYEDLGRFGNVSRTGASSGRGDSGRRANIPDLAPQPWYRF